MVITEMRGPESLAEIWMMFCRDDWQPGAMALMEVCYYMGARDAASLRHQGLDPTEEARRFLKASAVFEDVLLTLPPWEQR